MAITAAQVKELREMTGAGMMECKKALTEAEADMEKAVDLLREWGVAKIAKKAGRATNEGTIMTVVAEDGKSAVAVELNCETDFVSMNEKFKGYAEAIAKVALDKKIADIEALKADEEVAAQIADCVHVMGENTKLARVAYVEADGIVSYIHMGGKIGVLVEIGCTKPEVAASKELADAAHALCLQIAANSPKYIDVADVPQSEIDAELEIKLNALKEQKGKLPPEQALVGIKKGMAAKFCTQICLLKQEYWADDKLTMEKFLDGVAKNLGDTLTVKRFCRMQLGA